MLLARWHFLNSCLAAIDEAWKNSLLTALLFLHQIGLKQSLANVQFINLFAPLGSFHRHETKAGKKFKHKFSCHQHYADVGTELQQGRESGTIILPFTSHMAVLLIHSETNPGKCMQNNVSAFGFDKKFLLNQIQCL